MATATERKENIEKAQNDPLTRRSLETLVNKLFTEQELNHGSFSVNALNSFYTGSHDKTNRLFQSLGIVKDETGFHTTKTPAEMMVVLADNLTVTEFNAIRAFTKTLPHRRAEYNKRQKQSAKKRRQSAAERMARYRARKRAEKAQQTDADKAREKLINQVGSDNGMEHAMENRPAPQPRRNNAENYPEKQKKNYPNEQMKQNLIDIIAKQEVNTDRKELLNEGVRPFNKKQLEHLVADSLTENGKIDAEKMLRNTYKLSAQTPALHNPWKSLIFTASQARNSVERHSENVGSYPVIQQFYDQHVDWYGEGITANKLYYARILLEQKMVEAWRERVND